MKKSLLLCFSLVLLTLAFPAMAQQPLDPAKPTAIGRWTAQIVNGALHLDYDRVPLVRGGIVQVFKPDFSGGYYSSGGRSPAATTELLSDGGRAYLLNYRYTDEGFTFQAIQRIEVHPNDTVTWTMRTRWDGKEPATLEWNVARFWAYPFVGAEYQAETRSKGIVQGTVPFRPLRNAVSGNRFAVDWKLFDLKQTAFGDLSLKASSENEGPTLFDAREDRYQTDLKVFWLGYTGSLMPPGRETVNTITLTLHPNGPAPAPTETANQKPYYLPTTITAISQAQLPFAPLTDANSLPVIIPEPKQLKFTQSNFALSGTVSLLTDLPKTEEGRSVKQALRSFASDLQRNTGVRWKHLTNLAQQAGLRHPPLLRKEGPREVYPPLKGRAGRGQQPNNKKLLVRISVKDAPPHAEGYRLRVTTNSVEVIGHDARGAFYGLQTLRQLVRSAAKGTSVFVGADIQDWPSLRFRGAHIFSGRHALPFHQKLIERVFSRYKLNALVLECEYTQWKSHPEIHAPNSMPIEDLRKEIAFARDHFMEPLPLVNTLGHSEWIFANGKNLNLAEDVNSPHAYDASNPAAYKFVFDIYQEAIDLFKPRFFHIGHDEVKMLGSDVFGKYPARPENIRKGVTKLFTEDITKIADWLREHGARTMLWGDMLLHASEGATDSGISVLHAANAPTLEEAKLRRSLLPKDAIIADWRYEAGSEQRNGLKLFQEAGFPALGCPWFEPANIHGWAQQAVKNNAMGLLQTTWAGFDSNESLLEADFKQFSAFMLAAEYAWSGSTKHPHTAGTPVQKDPLAWDAGTTFTRAYLNVRLAASPRPGWRLDLRRAANIVLKNQNNSLPWEVLPTSQRTRANLPMQTITEPTTDAQMALDGQGIMLRGLFPARSQARKAVAVKIDQPAGTLVFAHASGFGVAAGSVVASYTIVYADGKRIILPLRYGKEIRALDDPASPDSYTTTAVTWNQQSDNPVTLSLYRWTNPRPKTAIVQIEFRAEDRFAAPTLFALTGW